jgi:16S rRNA (guanine966-N2)-methyltransferase
MRITGGLYKGRKIICPPGVIRPAMDRMRESLFAVLGDIAGRSFLDLYAGSGAVGIEAASRGADPVVFVEKDRGKRQIFLRNISFMEKKQEFHFIPVEHHLRREKRRFDYIFLDPPFRQKAKLAVLELIADKGLLAESGALVIHVPKEEEGMFPEVFGEKPLYLTDRRRYGGSLLLFYRSTLQNF